MLIQACLNGARTPGEHSALPFAPLELADAARAAVAAGASSLHVHPRGADGAQSLTAEAISDALTAVRAACPGVPVGISTLFAILPDQGRRVAAVHQWDERPNFVSVNIGEPGTTELCAALRQRGVGIEVGLASAADAEQYLALDLGGSCVRVLLEPEEADLAGALVTVVAIEAVLDAAGDRTSRLLHGEGPTAWSLIDAALARAYETRIGLEDVLTLPDGTLADDNAALVRAAFARVAVGPIVLRPVEQGDVPSLYAHQRDPEAAQMAGFAPRTWEVFQAHWARLQADAAVVNRTVLVGKQVAGSLACYLEDGERLIGYWFGRSFWGRGVATAALAQFVAELPPGPLAAYVGRHNTASRRVLEKCGFVLEREHAEELFLRYPM